MTIRYIAGSRKCSKNIGISGLMPGIQIITDQFGDGWYK